MSNRLYQSMMPQQASSFAQALGALKKNPLQVLAQMGMKLPDNVGNDPNAIIQHLMNTGQVSQAQYNAVMQTVGKMKG